MPEPLCRHCEARFCPPASALGLCEECASHLSIRQLYVSNAPRPPGWDENLKALTARARKGLPLFPDR
jgi:hypothetical protein